MSDIKLFKLANSGVQELSGTTDTIEKSVQVLFERHLEALLGVRFLATEFVTTNGGRMDTLGLDENGCPVIIEYKRAMNENVINQGLFYLDWLMDHRKDFQWLVMEKLGKAVADSVDWSAPCLICVAGDFNRYDDHAVRQIQRNIRLIKYRRFGEDLLLLDQVTSTSVKKPVALPGTVEVSPSGTRYKTISAVIEELDAGMIDRLEAVRATLCALGDDVQETMLRFYIAFKRIKNFACVEVRPREGRILIFLKIDPVTVQLEPGFSRDVSKIGHYGTGDLEVTLSRPEDLEKALSLIQRSYDGA
ncbi:transporter [Asticcacaulis sp. AC460]|uniref:DUF5655 domain-containing protein n=1 Tax=Asticcacaulis sp. AC460 TaxID=1282360 RepID=UPI0003C3DFC5|nr:DUF5655 domain-containing protein [Asticcacaulis sp. AC460]ESQ91310.1 transporter [Asticcacaulis sp. AC460]